MQKLIAGYLFQHKNCPLPGVGRLKISSSEAVFENGTSLINPPVPLILFSDYRSEEDQLEEHIAAHKHVSLAEAGVLLKNFCRDINDMGTAGQVSIAYVGRFSKDADERIVFNAEKLPEYFLPPVNALRVIHPDATHAILVGDKETDSAVMTEFFSGSEPTVKDRWWLWAIILFCIALSAFIAYQYNGNVNSLFGNAHRQPAKPAAGTYRIP